MAEEFLDRAVRPLDEQGNPIDVAPARPTSQHNGVVVAALVAGIALLAIGGVLAWRAFLGSPFAAAESVPADADMVITMDFLQVRDLDRVDRLIQAFAEPMARHGIIDEVPDLEAAMREIDDAAEVEVGFRFAEDVLSWIGRSGAIAIWFPEDFIQLDPYAEEIVPTFLATVEVRDQQLAEAFLDRVVAFSATEGTELIRIQIAGTIAYGAQGEPGVVALEEGRFIIGDSVDTVRRAVGVDAGDSVAQTDDFQRLAGAVGGDPIMTFYMAPGLTDKLTAAYEEAGIGLSFGDQFGATGSMTGMSLDDDGVVMRAASFALEDIEVSSGQWSQQLPADTYGFVDAELPQAYFSQVTDMYLDAMTGVGMTEQDIRLVTEPADDLLGMSLLDDLIPQFGSEMMFAVAPARDGMLALETGVELGLLFGIGVADSELVGRALDRGLVAAAEQGVVVNERNGVRVMEFEGAEVGAVAVTSDALFAASSPRMLGEFLEGSGGLASTDGYQRVEAVLAGDGLIFYVDIAGLVDEYATDIEVRDVLAPLVAVGASATVENDLQVAEFRMLIDY